MPSKRRKGGHAVGVRHIVKGLLRAGHDYAKENKLLSRGLKFLGLNTAGNVAQHFGYGTFGTRHSRKRHGGGAVKAVKF